MSELNVVVIGGVSAGPKAAARLKRLVPDAKVTLIERGHDISYGGCGLPYFIGSTVKQLSDLMTTSWDAVRTPEFMKATKDIDTLLGWEATKIDRENKIVEVKDVATGEEKKLPYDKVVIATGSKNFLPPIKNIDAEGVFGLKTPTDGLNIQNYLKTGVGKAVVIGAGLIGMETAEAFANWGVDVTVIEMMDQIFPKLVDKDLAYVVQNYLESEDMNFMLSTAVKEIKVDDEGKVCGVVTDQGDVDCELVLVSAGVRSEVGLAVDAGLEVDRTIVVNDYMQTSDPDIYAGGDCVSCTHRITGKKIFAPMGSTANKHGRIIADNIATNNTEKFPGVLGTSICKMFDWSIGKVGLTEADAQREGYDYVTCVVPGADITHFIPGKKTIMIKTVAEKGTRRILGVQAVGPGEVAKRIDTMAGALSVKPDLTAFDMANMDLAYAPPFSSAVDNLLVNGNVIGNELDGRAHSMNFWETVKRFNDDKSLFVDLRSDSEFSKHPFECDNYYRIPIEELRARCNELPKDKDILLFCHLSTRGYEAQLILEREGFKNVYFIQGGIHFWPFDKFIEKK
ncbi:MAG: FAD-dependent oxidoreductase [Peptococcaceae bacterium]|nr:FAD-dependent oxidoreductase [Peptococcaceae bacterium]